MELCDRGNYSLLEPQVYADRVLLGKPQYLADDNYQNFLYQQIASSKTERPTLSMVQFTDIHVDLDYAVGSNKHCDDILCCRAENGFPANVED